MNVGVMLLGLCAGVLTGMAAGGGSVMVPGLVLLFGIAQREAQGAVLAAFLVTQVVAAYGQWREGNIQFRLAGWMMPAALIGAAVGAWIAFHTRPAALRNLYGWYLILLGLLNWVNFRPRVK